MEVNYVYIFITVTIIAIVCFMKCFKTYSKESTDNSQNYYLTDLLASSCCAVSIGLFVCLFFCIFSSKVYNIQAYNSYSDKKYFLYFKDSRNKYHIVIPFTNYINNESKHEVRISPVHYSSYTSRHNFLY